MMLILSKLVGRLWTAEVVGADQETGGGVSLTSWDTHGTLRDNSIQPKPIDYNLQSYTI